MRPKGRRIAIVAAAFGMATFVAMGLTLRERILEEWYLCRFRDGDIPAKKKVLESMVGLGGEASWLAIGEELAKFGVDRDFGWVVDLENAEVKIAQKLGPLRLSVLVKRVLERRTGSTMLTLHVALGAIENRPGSWIQPGEMELADRRLRESLVDPDPRMRAGSASAIAGGGERAPSLLPALAPLKSDADSRVREAAVAAIKRLSK